MKKIYLLNELTRLDYCYIVVFIRLNVNNIKGNKIYSLGQAFKLFKFKVEVI